jgi:uncharacterized membrane protein
VTSRRYGRDSLEFTRIAALSDGLFAIALTLLVFTLDPTVVSLERPAGVLTDQLGSLIAFVLTFAVVANFWWVHHRFVANLGVFEPGLLLLNLALLGAVALIPFPTSLLGRDPTAVGAVVPYLSLLTLVAALHLLLLVRAQAAEAWRRRLPRELFPWLLGGWGASTAVTVVGLGVAFVVPVAGLAALLLTWPAEALVARLAPNGYRDWG